MFSMQKHLLPAVDYQHIYNHSQIDLKLINLKSKYLEN